MSEQVEIRGTKWKLCSDGVWRTDKEFWGTPITDAIDEVIALRARVAELERETVTQIHPDAKRVRLLVESFAAGYSIAGTDMHDIHQSATHRAIVEAWIPPVQPVRIMRAEVKP